MHNITHASCRNVVTCHLAWTRWMHNPAVLKLTELALMAWFLAYVLSCTPDSVWSNIPLAAAFIVILRFLVKPQNALRQFGLSTQQPISESVKLSKVPSDAMTGLTSQPALTDAERQAWRKEVRSKVVEFAWDKLCGSLVQQWVYNTWYAALTPDKEFPSEIRHMLNTLFGELCRRCHGVDTRALLIKDVCGILTDQIDLYRQTVAAVGEESLAGMTPAARERALQREMKAMGQLHTALWTPDGHYKYLRNVSEMMLRTLIPGHPFLQLRVGSVARELTAACLLRPIMMFCLPYNINKLLLNLLKDQDQPQCKDSLVQKLLVEGAQKMEARIRSSVSAEDLACSELSLNHKARIQVQKLNSGADKVDILRSCPSSLESSEEWKSSIASRSGQVPRGSTSPATSNNKASLPSLLQETSTCGKAFQLLEDQGGIKAFHTSQNSCAAHTDIHPKCCGPLDGSLRASEEASSVNHISPSWHSSHTDSQQTPGTGGVRTDGQMMSASWHFTEAEDGSWSVATNRSSSSVHQRASNSGHAFVSSITISPALSWPSSAGAVREIFVGYPRAVVVHSEIRQETRFVGTQHEYVVYVIRVMDGAGEWSVTRRYRNFETLHQRLQTGSAEYRSLKITLPTKHLLHMSQDTAFVHQRRKELDLYMSRILRSPLLASCHDVWLFLRPGSEQYAPPKLAHQKPPHQPLFTPQLSAMQAEAFTSNSAHALHRRHKSAASDEFECIEKETEGLVTVGSLDNLNLISMSAADSKNSKAFGGGIGLQGKTIWRSRDSRLQGEMHSSEKLSGSTPSPAITKQPFHDNIRGLRYGTSVNGSLLRMTSEHEETPSHTNWTQDVARDSGVVTAEQCIARRPFFPQSEEDQAAEYAEALGASAPLLDLVDVLFQLQNRGFVWRQVSSVARQMLSLVAGDAIDLYLIRKLHAMTSEHSIARAILAIQNALWPGGVWFAWFNQQQQMREATFPGSVNKEREKDQAEVPGEAHDKAWVPTWTPPPAMQAERFLEPSAKSQDEEEICQKLLEKLLSKCPSAVVTVLGLKNYSSSVSELHSMLQSSTFMLQVGYRIMDAALSTVIPEGQVFTKQFM